MHITLFTQKKKKEEAYGSNYITIIVAKYLHVNSESPILQLRRGRKHQSFEFALPLKNYDLKNLTLF